jgi:hypothetical protein
MRNTSVCPGKSNEREQQINELEKGKTFCFVGERGKNKFLIVVRIERSLGESFWLNVSTEDHDARWINFDFDLGVGR